MSWVGEVLPGAAAIVCGHPRFGLVLIQVARRIQRSWIDCAHWMVRRGGVIPSLLPTTSHVAQVNKSANERLIVAGNVFRAHHFLGESQSYALLKFTEWTGELQSSRLPPGSLCWDQLPATDEEIEVDFE